MPKDNSGYRELEGRTQEGERRNHITPILLKATIFLLNVQFAQEKKHTVSGLRGLSAH